MTPFILAMATVGAGASPPRPQAQAVAYARIVAPVAISDGRVNAQVMLRQSHKLEACENGPATCVISVQVVE